MSLHYLEEDHWNYRLVTLPIIIFVSVFLIWSYFAEIDESVKGSGKIIPSGQTRLIQHLEGGIITNILVTEGAAVEEGQVLFRIQNQYFISGKKETAVKLIAYKAKLKRIEALLKHLDSPIFDKEMLDKIPNIIDNETQTFYSQKQKYNSQLSVLQDQLQQKRSQLKELEVRLENLTVEYNLILENMRIQEDLAKKNIISREKFLQHLTAKQKLYTQLEEARYSIPTIRKEIDEWEKKIEGKTLEVQVEILKESNEVQLEINRLNEVIQTDIDRDFRMDLVSPTKGLINKLHYNTIGGIVKSGDTIAEISPLEDELMIEAKINAADRAYIHPGQHVSIEITAYDSSKYGLLDGELISISPDSSTDEQGNNFYTVKVRASDYKFDDTSPILMGMTSNINILTGKRTVLQYLIKPLKNIKYNALKEH